MNALRGVDLRKQILWNRATAKKERFHAEERVHVFKCATIPGYATSATAKKTIQLLTKTIRIDIKRAGKKRKRMR